MSTKRFELMAIANPGMSGILYLNPLDFEHAALTEFDTQDDAKTNACALARHYSFGIAIVDRADSEIDYGDEVTDFSGRQIAIIKTERGNNVTRYRRLK